MYQNRIFQSLIVFVILSFAFFGCQQQQQEKTPGAMVEEEEGPTQAVCVLHPTEGNDVSGIVTFTKTAEGIEVVAKVSGLTPGKHGFHVHELGDCSVADGTSAGGHFNPEGTKHGAPSDNARHIGDLGNLEADDEGNAHYERTDTFLALSGPHSIVGRAIIVHAGEDDLTSQPTGAAGARVACGVIGITE